MPKTSYFRLIPLFFAASIASAQTAQDTHFEFNAKIGEAGTVPVDCDLLGPRGALTSKFVMQLDPSGHFESPFMQQQIDKNARLHEHLKPEEDVTDVQKTAEIIRHLGLHGIAKEKIEKIAAYCAKNFPHAAP